LKKEPVYLSVMPKSDLMSLPLPVSTYVTEIIL
jgi:hypothetical protein